MKPLGGSKNRPSIESVIFDDSPLNSKYMESRQGLILDDFKKRLSYKVESEYPEIVSRNSRKPSIRQNVSSKNIKPNYKPSFKRLDKMLEVGSVHKEIRFDDQNLIDNIELNDNFNNESSKSIKMGNKNIPPQTGILKNSRTDLIDKNKPSVTTSIHQKRRLTYINYRSSVSVIYQSRKQSVVEFQYLQTAMAKSFQRTTYQIYSERKMYIEVALGFLSLTNIILSLIDTQLFINRFDLVGIQVKSDDLPASEIAMRILNTLISLVMAILVYLRYNFIIRLKISDNKLSKNDSIFTSNDLMNYLTETLVTIVFYPPGLTGLYIGEVNQFSFVIVINAIFTLAVLFKIFHTLRLYKHFSMYSNFDAISICNKFEVHSKNSFLVKAEVKARPFLVVSIVLVMFILLMSFSLRTFENGLNLSESFNQIINSNLTDSTRHLIFNFIEQPPGKGTQGLNYIYNSMWFIIQTITTVGYGDAFPKTHFGRAVGAIACIIGIFLISMITLSLSPFVEFNSEERKAYLTMKQMQLETNIKMRAKQVITVILEINRVAQLRKKDILNEIVPKGEEKGKELAKMKKIRQEKKINSLSKQFILFTQLKKNINIFKLDNSTSKITPLDELLHGMRKKLRSELGKLSVNVEHIESIIKEINELNISIVADKKKLQNLVGTQNLIFDYLIKLNNSKVGSNIKLKLHPLLKQGPSKKGRGAFYRGSDNFQNVGRIKDIKDEIVNDIDIGLKRNAFTFNEANSAQGGKYATTSNIMGFASFLNNLPAPPHPTQPSNSNQRIIRGPLRRSSPRISTQSMKNEIVSLFCMQENEKKLGRNRSFSDKSILSFRKASYDESGGLVDSMFISQLETSAQNHCKNAKDYRSSIAKDNCINEIKESTSRSLSDS